jgi:hypothetical protein
MKYTGEGAASIKTGNSQRQNTTDLDIERYEKKAESYINQFKEANNYSFSSYSHSETFTHTHCGGHHGHH